MEMKNFYTKLLVLFCCAGMLLTVVSVHAQSVVNDSALAGARIEYHQETGKVRFIGTAPDQAIRSTIVGVGVPKLKNSIEDFVALYAPAFGIRSIDQELRLSYTQARAAGGMHARYQQVYEELPVIVGELVININHNGALLAMGGEISPDLKLNTLPLLNATQAEEIALNAISKWYSIDNGELWTSEPRLAIYDPKLLKPSMIKPSLVWELEVNTLSLLPIREYILIDAQSGAINLHFNKIHNAKNRQTYTAGGTDSLPGILVCDETDSNCIAGDADARNAHAFTGHTYDFYANYHNRDSLDNVGGALISTVHWDDGITCPNAFWNGVQMAYCDGMAADDVVGHELTHGVTEFESALFYYYQSGAINESLSDIWGEFIDLTNGSGTDTPTTRWLLGEDLPASIGVLRNMKDPTQLSSPDKMTSPYYFLDSEDNGGVHFNSGINNKAAYLLTDGGTFNSKTVAALGLNKVAKIYYEAQTQLLTSGSDYADLHAFLNQACQNLIGTSGITAENCQQVRNAVDAVEMDQQPVPGFNPDAALCHTGQTVGSILFFDDLEISANNWTTQTLSGTNNPWSHATGYAASGIFSLYNPNLDSISDAVVFMKNAVNLPANVYLHFRHGFSFESFMGSFFDGGVIEYTINNGASWLDMNTHFDAGKGYDGTIETSFDNPLAGRNAFVAESHGYVSSRYNLSSLAGQNVKIRFRLGSDEAFGGPLGWTVDDIQIYTCSTNGLPPDPSCSGTNVLIQNNSFFGNSNCIATQSLETNASVKIGNSANVNFISPNISLGPGFHVDLGGVFKAGNN